MASGVADFAGSRLAGLHLLSWRFRLVLGAVLVACLLTLALSEFTVRAAARDAEQLKILLRRLAETQQLLGLLVDTETGQRGYLLTGETVYLEPYKAAVRDLAPLAVSLRSLVPADSELRQRLDQVDALARERLELATTTISLARAGQREAALDLVRSGKGRRLMDQLRDQLGTVERRTQAELQALQVRQNSGALWARLALLGSTATGIVLLVLVARLAIDQAAAELRTREAAARDTADMQDIITARTAELLDLWSHLQSTTEREKADLARNLHDELGGLLTAARMDLAWLQRASTDREPAFLARLQQLADEISAAMDVKRRVVENLRPALLDHFGLPLALQSHFEEMCVKAELQCHVSVADDIPDLPDELSIALFRVGQESLTNIVRHASARNVHLRIGMDGSDLTLDIRDDGSGINAQEASRQHSHGIRGMRHRIESLGGTFAVRGRSGSGTQIHIRSPLQRQPAPAGLPGPAA